MGYIVKAAQNENLIVSGQEVSLGKAIPNHFYILETLPEGLESQYVEVPPDIFDGFKFYEYDETTKMGWDPYNGEVEMIPIEDDLRARRYLRFNDAQKVARKNSLMWMIDHWIADAISMGRMTPEDAAIHKATLESLYDTPKEFKTYMYANMMYDV